MIGHSDELRPSHIISDYVLAHSYLRDDHMLADILPVEIPIPTIAEVQEALFRAAACLASADEDNLKKRLWTGTVVTTDDRNRELRYTQSTLRFIPRRGSGDRHESATVAAQSYRFRVPLFF